MQIQSRTTGAWRSEIVFPKGFSRLTEEFVLREHSVDQTPHMQVDTWIDPRGSTPAETSILPPNKDMATLTLSANTRGEEFDHIQGSLTQRAKSHAPFSEVKRTQARYSGADQSSSAHL